MIASQPKPSNDRIFNMMLTLGLFLSVTLPLYRWFWPIVTKDLAGAYIPWFEHIVQHGPIASFSSPFSDYNPPYLYWIALGTFFHGHFADSAILKICMLCLVGFLSAAVYSLLRVANVSKYRAIGAGLAIFSVPTVIANAVMMTQCDALWAAPCLLVVVCTIQRRPAAMMFWCGVALAMKFQAIFIAPFALGALLTLRPKWWHWLVPAGSYMLCLLPALVAGWPLSDLFTVYFRQTQFYGVQMVLNAPNPWVIISFLHLGNPAMEFWVAKGLALIAGLLIVRKIQISEVKPDNLIALALLSAITMPYLLPAMHERYFFLADILSICLYVAKRDTRSLLTAIFVQLGSFAAIFAFITGETTWAKLSTGEVVLQLYNAHDLRYGLVSVASMTIAVVLVLIRIHAIPRASTQA